MATLLGLSAVGASAKGVRGDARSRSSDCNAFEGVFRALGRYSPAQPIGAPVPGRAPHDLEFENDRFLGRDLLGWTPDCDLAHGLPCDTASGSPGETEPRLLRGPMVVRLQEGEPLRLDGLLFSLRSVGINRRRDGYYDTSASVFVACEERTIELTRDHSGGPVELYRVCGRELAFDIGYARDRPRQARIWLLPAPPGSIEPDPARGVVRRVLTKHRPTEVGDFVLTLESAGHASRDIRVDDHGKVRISSQWVSITAEKGGASATVRLSRDHATDLVFGRVFDREVALETSIVHSKPSHATAVVWVRDARPAGAVACEPRSPDHDPLVHRLTPGRYRLTLVAERGSRSGATIEGELTLRATSPDDRSPRTGEPPRDRGEPPPMWGWTDAPVAEAGVPLCHDETPPDSADPVYPGVLVLPEGYGLPRRPPGAPVLLLATVQNRRDGARRLDGCGAGLSVRGHGDGVFWGDWQGWGVRKDGEGRFCLEPLSSTPSAPARTAHGPGPG